MPVYGNLIQSQHAGKWQSDQKVSMHEYDNLIKITHHNYTSISHIYVMIYFNLYDQYFNMHTYTYITKMKNKYIYQETPSHQL